MKYGYFNDARREYIITNPKTPVKWINYIGSLAFGGFVDHTGGALLCKGDPAFNRITKYIAQMPSSDFKGETLYLRLKTDGGYRIFSPFFVPCLAPYDHFECHVGLGYTRFVTQTWGIEADITIFVPRGQSRELRLIRITNRSSLPMEVDAIPVVEYTHFDALKQLTNADWVPQTMQSELIQDQDGLKILSQYAFMHKTTHVNYFTSNLPASSFETDRKLFLGENEYGTWAAPLSLLAGDELSNTQAQRGDNIAALLHPLGVFQPGETRVLITQLGQEQNIEQTLAAIHEYRSEEAVRSALQDLSEFWDHTLSRFQVHTPDPALDTMLNIHNPHQCYITFNWSRYLSLYQLGYGERGIGFRDSTQDVMAIFPYLPQEGKALLRKLFQVQKRDGSAMHSFNPLTMQGSVGDAAERDDRPNYYSDDHLWAVLAAAAYLKETGDIDFLQEEQPYYEKDRQGVAVEGGTIWDHMQRAVEFTHRDRGAHGLPLLGFADWNDPVNLPTGAESVFTAGLYGKALSELIALADYMSQRMDLINPPGQVRMYRDTAERLRGYYQEIKDRVNQHAWDGENSEEGWYRAYFEADGTPLGSRRNEYGRMYIHALAWVVFSGLATPERAQMTLDAIYRHLNTPNGIKTNYPSFNGYDPRKGGITTYPPGAKENGGIFLHTNPWIVFAETMLGNARRAYQYYAQINPAAKNEIIDQFECEPYVYPQNILGDEHPQFGLARNSWLSGTASWMLQTGMQAILGIQPGYDGLRLAPCFPADWEQVIVERQYRGAKYIIAIQNPNHTGQGVRQVMVDGKPIKGDTLPFLPPGRYEVTVTL
jgi:cellobiose phosphorylase